MKIKLLELFSGIGGFAKGLTDAGFDIETHLFSEIDKHAIANYKYNFKNAQSIGSVTDVRGGGIERPNIITFGSPCQDFSLAGKREGLDGSRSSLVHEAIRIIGECRPDIFIWENVKGAFSSNHGADFWAIIAAFTHIGGYRLEWQLLNTSWFLPQNRERIYLVGHLDGRSTPSVFPFREDDFLSESKKQVGIKVFGNLNSSQDGQIFSIDGISQTLSAGHGNVPKIAACLTGGGHSGGLHSDMTTIGVRQINPSKESGGQQPYQQNRVYDADYLAPTINQESGRFSVKVGHVTRTEESKAIRRESMKTMGKDYSPFQGKELVFKSDEVMNTITCATQKDNLLEVKDQIRRLTEIECERLQGFPGDWTRWGDYDGKIKEIPKTQRYKLIGNAVTRDIVELIGERLLNNLNKQTAA